VAFSLGVGEGVANSLVSLERELHEGHEDP